MDISTPCAKRGQVRLARARYTSCGVSGGGKPHLSERFSKGQARSFSIAASSPRAAARAPSTPSNLTRCLTYSMQNIKTSAFLVRRDRIARRLLPGIAQ